MKSTFTNKFSRLLALILLTSTIGFSGHVHAQSVNVNPNGLRVIFLSELPEGITYYDQGFGDFIRESKLVPVINTSIATATKATITRELTNQGFDVSLVDAPLDLIQARADVMKLRPRTFFAPSMAEKMAPILSNLKQQNLAEVIIIVSPGKLPQNDSWKG
jgi:hypothetical protein